jgi:tetraacyldisaccharide 4'-kinase
MSHGRWQQRLVRTWYSHSRWSLLVLPLSWLFCAFAVLRRSAYRSGLLRRHALGVKVVVVGNITVGGTGKTPMVIALVQRLQRTGLCVGILCRGYRGRSRHWPLRVTAASDPQQVGDEAVLLAARTGAPVFAGPDRLAAGRALLAQHPCDVLICDDGLQHYRLRRDLEILLVDPRRGYGNRQCLPAGPLREPLSRLQTVDAVVEYGAAAGRRFGTTLSISTACRLADPPESRPLDAFSGQSVHAVAGIADPQRFFSALRGVGIEVEPHAFPDHHAFSAEDLAFDDSRPVLMTEKDAVKCAAFAASHWWSVPAELELDAAFVDWLVGSLK